jgi:hypothetical protein
MIQLPLQFAGPQKLLLKRGNCAAISRAPRHKRGKLSLQLIARAHQAVRYTPSSAFFLFENPLGD